MVDKSYPTLEIIWVSEVWCLRQNELRILWVMRSAILKGMCGLKLANVIKVNVFVWLLVFNVAMDPLAT